MGATYLNIPSYKGMELDALGISERLAAMAVRIITIRAVPKCFPQRFFDIHSDTTTIAGQEGKDVQGIRGGAHALI